ncbi:transcriptional activator domain protein [Chloroflexus aggregans DSM 9485]|uniref:Transcriptional activator domain protein n=2 Tax=Chloroflexus aggregans TaxID=152260 RepID=B8G308_CHLAD|nr:transcriptional activator domain protein [Chloroflexus aggregans DSM 9485]
MTTAMAREKTVLLPAKVAPPRPHRYRLVRPAVTARLREAFDYRVTLVQAGAGYSKTTALAELATSMAPVCWYTIGEDDRDPVTFLTYLTAACAPVLPQGVPDVLAMLHARPADRTVWTHVLDELLNALAGVPPKPTLLILDDYHFVTVSAEIRALTERLITYAPPWFSLLIATRYPIVSGELVRWRARGEVLELNREALAFTRDEIAALFTEVFGIVLSDTDIDLLSHQTEGWPIALQLVWQGLRSRQVRSVAEVLADSPTSLAALFDFLASDVLARQPPEIAAFLRDTAPLRVLTAAACDAVRQAHDSSELLAQVRDRDLFIVELGDEHYRYHHLFHDFLRQQIRHDPDIAERHRRAARHYTAIGAAEEAIHHWFAAGEGSIAADAIESAGEEVLRNGRLDTLADWIDALPAEIIAARPRLQCYLGDLYRLRARFDEARRWYVQAEATSRQRGDRAELARALYGLAQVYIDQVQPSQAESVLQEALRVSEGLEDHLARARVLELLAENKLNMGQPAEAEALQHQAQQLRAASPAADLLSARVKLRTGQLAAARALLQAWRDHERIVTARGVTPAPRGHREAVLVLALIAAFEGDPEQALAFATEGVQVGFERNSQFITSVAYARIGHAWLLKSATEGIAARAHALDYYRQALAEGMALGVERLRVEPLWGMTRLYGLAGDLAAAESAAADGQAFCRWAGDLWLGAMIQIQRGVSHLLVGEVERALELLVTARADLRACSDRFGQAVTALWLALGYHELRQEVAAIAAIVEALELSATHGYDYLFTRPTFLGLIDPRRALPILLAARSRGHHREYIDRLLSILGLRGLDVHPGYQLRVQTLGGFRVWRGDHEIEAREWQRDKARQLFQALIIHRDRWLQRDELVEMLWPHLAPETAIRDFKVALSTLYRVLEPIRTDAPSAFIVRDGSAYRLRPNADLWLDCAEFRTGCTTGLRLLDHGRIAEGIHHLHTALQLYQGDFLPDTLYESWAMTERERLRTMFVRSADRLAQFLAEQGRDDDLIALSERILVSDPCWERAYRFLMLAYARRGNRATALRMFQRCRETLARELDVEPAPETIAFAERLRHGDPILPPVTDL